MINAIVTSKTSGRTMQKSFTPNQLLDLYEDELVSNVTQCNCQQIPESYDYDCNCYEEWEDYNLELVEEGIR